MEKPKISKKQQAHVNKYISKAYDRISLVVKKGQREVIKQHSELTGESVNAFIQRAINETMERDKEKSGES